jgi:hypothetical protein
MDLWCFGPCSGHGLPSFNGSYSWSNLSLEVRYYFHCYHHCRDHPHCCQLVTGTQAPENTVCVVREVCFVVTVTLPVRIEREMSSVLLVAGSM